MAGYKRRSASLRSSLSSMLPVPLNSSKITSSILEPVSTRAVARMVREPPSSMFRAAPKNFFGGESAVEATPPGEDAAARRRLQVVCGSHTGDGVEEHYHVLADFHQPLNSL